MTMSEQSGDWTPKIEARLRAALDPLELEVHNDSDAHAGHAGSPGTGNSHFRVRVVSPRFAGESLVQRHRRIYEILAEEMQSGIHALAIEARTPGE
ncbi:MAG: BolA family transcriptional regulator [bacterium]|nr:BolA family transcriptional regulator [bacterium]